MFAEYALANVTYTNNDGIYSVDCNEDLSQMYSVFIMVEERWLEIPPESYILKLAEDVCVFGIIRGSGEYFILG